VDELGGEVAAEKVMIAEPYIAVRRAKNEVFALNEKLN